MANITIKQYIKASEKDREAFALIAKNEDDMGNFTHELINLGYEEVADSKQARERLTAKKKIFGIVNPENCEFYYTLAKDFGAGAMQFFDFKTNKISWMHPSEESAICLIILHDDIKKINEKGFNFQNVCISAFNQ